VPTYNNGSNSNLDSDDKRAVIFMPVEATEARGTRRTKLFSSKNLLDELRRKGKADADCDFVIGTSRSLLVNASSKMSVGQF
jgi:hypothetical protein